jgi:hypothetical protein
VDGEGVSTGLNIDANGLMGTTGVKEKAGAANVPPKGGRLSDEIELSIAFLALNLHAATCL